MNFLLNDNKNELIFMENVEKVVVDEGMITGDAKPILIYSDRPKVAGSGGSA